MNQLQETIKANERAEVLIEVMEAAVKYIMPIMIKYELENSKNERAAMIEAFQAGIKFYHNNPPSNQQGAVD